MITITLENVYYIFSILGIICGVSYKLGYENGKNKRK